MPLRGRGNWDRVRKEQIDPFNKDYKSSEERDFWVWRGNEDFVEKARN